MYSATFPQLRETWIEGFASNKPFTISPVFFSYSPEQNHEDASGLMRYVFEDVLDWSPYDVQNHCTKEVIDLLGLRPAYRALLWPCTYDDQGNAVPLIDSRSGYGYVASLLYPDVIHTLGKKSLWVMEYNTILSGKKRSKGFRVDDFLGTDGFNHARLLLNHYLVNNPDSRFTCIDDVYATFADKEESEKILEEARLSNIGHVLFHNNLDFLHASLPDDGSESGCDHFAYDFYRFENAFRDIDVIMDHKKEILNAFFKEGKSCHAINTELKLGVDEDVLYNKIRQWQEMFAEKKKDAIINMCKHHRSCQEISEKSKIDIDIIERKLNEWGVRYKWHLQKNEDEV